MARIHKSLELFLRQPTPTEATQRDVERALDALGFHLHSHESSHYTWLHPDGARITYALVSGRTVKRVVVKAIAKEIRRQGRDAWSLRIDEVRRTQWHLSPWLT